MKASINSEEYFLISSPEEELKEISMVESIDKGIFDSPRLKQKSAEKFAIQSWDYSQKLKPFHTLDLKNKHDSFSRFSSINHKRQHRVKSAFLLKNSANTNDHNFSALKRSLYYVQKDKKQLSFFSKSLNTIEKNSISISLAKSNAKNQTILNSQNKLRRKLVHQKEEQRTKTIQNYLTHQKQAINREKSLLHNSRVGKEGLQFFVYPTEYWAAIDLQQTVKKTNHKVSNKKNPLGQQKQRSLTQSPWQKIKLSNKMEESTSTKQNKIKSPIKRFRLFVDNIHQKSVN